jgi:hypothetical protein
MAKCLIALHYNPDYELSCSFFNVHEVFFFKLVFLLLLRVHSFKCISISKIAFKETIIKKFPDGVTSGKPFMMQPLIDQWSRNGVKQELNSSETSCNKIQR